VKTQQMMVIEFHKACDQPILDRPTVPDDDRVRLRAALVIEEALEFVEALFDMSCPAHYTGLDMSPVAASDDMRTIKRHLKTIIEGAPVKVNLPEAIDALADIDYVVAGSYLEFGVDSEPIAATVHAANMSKVSGPIGPNGKRLKPEGFRPPDIAAELAFQAATPHGGLGHKLITLRGAFDPTKAAEEIEQAAALRRMQAGPPVTGETPVAVQGLGSFVEGLGRAIGQVEFAKQLATDPRGLAERMKKAARAKAEEIIKNAEDEGLPPFNGDGEDK